MELPEQLIIAAGPVIIEDNAVLLNREIKFNGAESPFFMFPGGRLTSIEENPEDACKREAKEELGIEVELLRPLKTLIVQRPDVADGWAILIHYLAKRVGEVQAQPGRTVEWGWFDVRDLPKNCTDNVRNVIEAYLRETV